MTSPQEADGSSMKSPWNHQRAPAPQATDTRTGDTSRNRPNSIFIDGGKGTVELRTDGITHIIWKPQGIIEYAGARAAMAAINELLEGSEHPMLVDLATTDSVSRDARAVFSVPRAVSRIALPGSSPVDRVIASFFPGVHTSPCPTRFFTSRNEAIGWLTQNPASALSVLPE